MEYMKEKKCKTFCCSDLESALAASASSLILYRLRGKSVGVIDCLFGFFISPLSKTAFSSWRVSVTELKHFKSTKHTQWVTYTLCRLLTTEYYNDTMVGAYRLLHINMQRKTTADVLTCIILKILERKYDIYMSKITAKRRGHHHG